MNDDGAPSLGEQWKACVDEMRENYVVANENYKYLGTLQEFLLVSAVLVIGMLQ